MLSGDIMNIGFIGAGKVGFTLGKYFSENNLTISGYYSQNHESAKQAAEFTDSAAFSNLSELVKASAAIFITVPDGKIKSVYDEIKFCGIEGKQICHCSGSLSVNDTFSDISDYGAAGCSVHPLFPVSSKLESYKVIKNAFFCLEGNENAIAEWERLLNSFGNRTRIINSADKSKYHAACAISSNLVCAVIDTSLSLLEQCGFSRNDALSALYPLALSNISNVFSKDTAQALTGPIERNDISTVKKHLECFDSETEKQMYKAVSLRLIDVAQRKHPETDYSEIKGILI